jgi:UDP-glucose 4-epimerase
MTENLIPVPEDSYGISKLSVEQELKVSHEMFGLDYVIFRPHNVYGERQNIGDKYRNVVGIFMNQIMQGKPMTIFGDGTQTRAFSYIRDVAPAIANSVHVPAALNQIFNVGADQAYTVNELACAVAEAMGVKPEIVYLQARNEVQHAYASHEKARNCFHLPEPASLCDGLTPMAEWAKSVGCRASKKFENIEILKNLPPSWLS